MQQLLDAYPALRGIVPPDSPLSAMEVPAGTELFREDEPCHGFPLVLDGEVTVSQASGEGRSIELYRVCPGELCLVSSACLFQARAMPAHGVATRPTRLLLVPPSTFTEWMSHPPFRDYVLGLFAQRMADLSLLVDAIAFQKLDRRLANALLGHGPELAVTHQALADSVGTVREMVTRVLRRFEREGWIEQSRERIRILDSAALRDCASGV